MGKKSHKNILYRRIPDVIRKVINYTTIYVGKPHLHSKLEFNIIHNRAVLFINKKTSSFVNTISYSSFVSLQTVETKIRYIENGADR